MTTSIGQLNRRLELLWWVLTILVSLAVLAPILLQLQLDYPFLWINLLYIISFITISRYLFFLHYTFLAYRQRWKIAVALLCIPWIFYLVEGIHFFQEYLDNEGLMSMVLSVPVKEQIGLALYIKNEFILFGVGSIVSSALFASRLVISVWRLHNRGTV